MPPKIALLTLDSAISNQAINDFIDRHRGQVAQVIVSNPMSRRRGGSIGQFLRLNKHSGLKFSLFLSYCFFIFPLYIAARFLAGKLTAGKGGILSIKEQCRMCNIEYIVSDNINSPRISRLLEEQEIELIVTCFFDQILGSDIIGIPGLTCLNIHPGILPACRGVFPEIHTAAGKYHDFGFTIHCIDDMSIDTGRILLTRVIKVGEMKGMLAIGQKLLMEGLLALTEILPDIEIHLANAQSQEEGNYFSYPDREDIRKLEDAGYFLW